jgi:hypothetical protein
VLSSYLETVKALSVQAEHLGLVLIGRVVMQERISPTMPRLASMWGSFDAHTK